MRGTPVKYKVRVFYVPQNWKKNGVSELFQSRNLVSRPSEGSFLLFFQVKNKLTSNLYKLRISSTSPLQYGVLHIPSEAVLNSLKCWHLKQADVSPPLAPSYRGHAGGFLSQQTGPALLLFNLTPPARLQLRCFHMVVQTELFFSVYNMTVLALRDAVTRRGRGIWD